MIQPASRWFSATPHRWGIKALFYLKKWQILVILSRQAAIFQNTVCLAKFQNRHLWQLAEINCNRWQVLLYNKVRNRHLWQLKSPLLTR